MISTKSLKVEASRDLEEKLISPVKSAVWTGTDLKTSAPEAVAVPGELGQHSPALVQASSPPDSDSGLTVAKPVAAKTTRSSLQASTWDGVFAAIFANIAGGVLLSSFLVELDASTVQIGMVMAIPMLVNLIQPLGAYLANQTTSRHWYGLIVYIPSRLLWLFLVLGILVAGQQVSPNTLIQWTFGIVLISNILAALGSASWFSWMTTLVPARLRGRYFGIRNSAVSLCTLVSVPLAAWGVSAWPGGTLQGYGVILLLGTLAGLLSVGFQYWMKDVNPQAQVASLPKANQQLAAADQTLEATQSPPAKLTAAWQDPNLINFLIYFGFWAFAINLSSPFFNIYLLDNLGLDVRWVTLYNSLTAGTNLLMLIFWGKLSDRSGNRPLLLLVGILVAVTPLFWLGIGTDALSLWLWLPLLHIFMGSTWPAIELCSNNIQMAIAPVKNHATFFAIAAAVAGGCGACGTLLGGSLAQLADYGGLPGMFALSSVLRLAALLPLIFVHEHRGQSLIQMAQTITAGVRPLLKPLPVKRSVLPARMKS